MPWIPATNCSRRCIYIYTYTARVFSPLGLHDISLGPSQPTNATPKHGHLSFFLVKCSSFRSLSFAPSLPVIVCLRFAIVRNRQKKREIRLEFRVFVRYIPVQFFSRIHARQSFRGGDIFFEPGEANNATTFIPIFFLPALELSLLVFHRLLSMLDV